MQWRGRYSGRSQNNACKWCLCNELHNIYDAQNTTGVTAIQDSTATFLAQQLDAVFTDIRPDAVKIGMVSKRDLIAVIAEKLKEYKTENIVIDPVMVATSGSKLIDDDAIAALQEYLIPFATVLTPNIPEAEVLSSMKIREEEDMITAAKIIYEKYQCAVLCKGGHSLKDANDLLCTKDGVIWLRGKHINNQNTHGTGCTLSSAIAANLAKGDDLVRATVKAKKYISGSLEVMLDLGKGSGPMDHGFAIHNEFSE